MSWGNNNDKEDPECWTLELQIDFPNKPLVAHPSSSPQRHLLTTVSVTYLPSHTYPLHLFKKGIMTTYINFCTQFTLVLVLPLRLSSLLMMKQIPFQLTKHFYFL